MHTVSDYGVPSPTGTSITHPITKAQGTSVKRDNYEPGAREITQQFRADTALTEDPNLVPNTDTSGGPQLHLVLVEFLST